MHNKKSVSEEIQNYIEMPATLHLQPKIVPLKSQISEDISG